MTYSSSPTPCCRRAVSDGARTRKRSTSWRTFPQSFTVLYESVCQLKVFLWETIPTATPRFANLQKNESSLRPMTKFHGVAVMYPFTISHTHHHTRFGLLVWKVNQLFPGEFCANPPPTFWDILIERTQTEWGKNLTPLTEVKMCISSPWAHSADWLIGGQGHVDHSRVVAQHKETQHLEPGKTMTNSSHY